MKNAILFILIFVISASIFGQNTNNDIENLKNKIKNRTPLEQTIILQQNIEKDLNNINLYILKAEIEINMKDYIEAKNTLTKATQLDQNNIKVLNLLGMVNFHLNNLSDSVKSFKNVIKIDKNNQFAQNYLAIIDPFNLNATTLLETTQNVTDIDMKKLNDEYTKYTTDKDDFAYLLYKKEINVIDDKRFNYTIHCVVKILSNQGVNFFREISYSYNSYEFMPTVVKAGTYDSNYNFTEVDKKNIVLVDKKDSSSASSMYTNRKYIAFPMPDIKKDSIVEFVINFNSTGKILALNVFDHYLFGSFDKIINNELIVRYPKTVNLKFLKKGNDIIEDTYDLEDKTEKRFTYKNTPVYNLKNESISIYELSPYVILSSFESWDHIAKWYSTLFEDTISKEEATDIIKNINLEGKSTFQKIDEIYQFIQKNINYIAIELEESALKPRIPSEVYNNKFGDCKDQAALLIYLLRKIGVEAYPVLVSTLDNGAVVKEIPSSLYFNHMITFIPKQKDVEEELFLDTTSSVTPITNIPSLDQGIDVFVIKNDGTGFFKTTPIIDSKINKIEEYYKQTVDITGGGEIQFKEKFEGAYSELIRYSFQGKTNDEIIDSFYTYQKKSYPNLKKEQLIITGTDKQSGNLELELKSEEPSITNVFFDGRQKINFSIKDINTLFNIPTTIKYEYIRNFLFTYKKTVEYVFPQNYKIIEGDIKNFSQENEYFIFQATGNKLSENNFIFTFEISLKKRIIKNEDLKTVNDFISGMVSQVNYNLVLQNNENFDYEEFYDKLSKSFKQKEIYENYIKKMIELKKLDKAEQIIEEAQKLFPDNIYFYIIKASLLLEKNELDKAENILSSALIKEPNNINLYYYLIDIYKKKQDDAGLEKVLLEANNKFKDNESIVQEVVSFYSRIENYDAAIDFVKNVIKDFPNVSNYHANIGYIYSLKKDFRNAEESFIKSIQLNERNAMALNNLAWLYCENDVKIREAIEYAKKACDLEPFSDVYLDTLAEAYFKNKEYDKAIEIIKKALKINPNYTYLQMQLEKIQKAKEMKDK